MSEYNKRWTREKFVEYRKLKRSGYSHEELKEHFGEDIYHSGLYNKNSNKIPKEIMEARVKYDYNMFRNPPKVPYQSNLHLSKLSEENDVDMILTFKSKDKLYVITLMFFPLDNNNPIYNFSIVTNNYYKKIKDIDDKIEFLNNGFIEEDEFNNIKNEVYSVLKDYLNRHLSETLISVKDIGSNKNLFKTMFPDIIENKITVDKNQYCVFKIIKNI